MNDNGKFDYVYSAPTENERKEIESIKKQYEQPRKGNGDKLQQLRDLNKRVTTPPLVISILLGILGVLILGIGMTLSLEWNIMIWGIVIGCVGIAVCAANYFVYKAVLKYRKAKYKDKIIELSNELLNEND